MNERYDVIIIGAGIGGLAAGSILAKNGMKALILEKNYACGGGVGTFTRGGWPIDISHALCAFKEGACLRNYLEYLGIYNKLEFIEEEKTFIYVRPEGKPPIFCYSDLDKYAEELKKYFPAEYKNIKRLFKEISEIWYNEVLKSYYNPSLWQLALYPFLFPRLFRYRNYTFEQFLSRFIRDPELKDVLACGWPYLGMEKEYLSAIYMICLFGAYHCDQTYFIKGGFGKLVEALVEKFKELGGEIKLNCEVDQILVNKKVAYGVKDKQGNIYQAKRIVSNADSKKTFLELLDKTALPKKFIKKVDDLVMTRSCVQAHIFAEAEVGKDFLSCGSIILPFRVDLESKLRADLSDPSLRAQRSNPVLILSVHPLENFTSTSHAGAFVFNVFWYPANYQLWKKYSDILGKDAYETMKVEAGKLILEEIKKVWEIKEVKLTYVMTPVSLEKWLGATEGAVYDAAAIPKQMLLNRLKHKTPVRNLYLAGAKSFPGGGIAGALISGFTLGDMFLNQKLTKRKLNYERFN